MDERGIAQIEEHGQWKGAEEEVITKGPCKREREEEVIKERVLLGKKGGARVARNAGEMREGESASLPAVEVRVTTPLLVVVSASIIFSYFSLPGK